jgi:hypothetical protein
VGFVGPHQANDLPLVSHFAQNGTILELQNGDRRVQATGEAAEATLVASFQVPASGNAEGPTMGTTSDIVLQDESAATLGTAFGFVRTGESNGEAEGATFDQLRAGSTDGIDIDAIHGNFLASDSQARTDARAGNAAVGDVREPTLQSLLTLSAFPSS